MATSLVDCQVLYKSIELKCCIAMETAIDSNMYTEDRDE